MITSRRTVLILGESAYCLQGKPGWLSAARAACDQQAAHEEQTQRGWLWDVGGELCGDRIVEAKLVEVLRPGRVTALEDAEFERSSREPGRARDDGLVQVECGGRQQPFRKC